MTLFEVQREGGRVESREWIPVRYGGARVLEWEGDSRERRVEARMAGAGPGVGLDICFVMALFNLVNDSIRSS